MKFLVEITFTQLSYRFHAPILSVASAMMYPIKGDKYWEADQLTSFFDIQWLNFERSNFQHQAV